MGRLWEYHLLENSAFLLADLSHKHGLLLGTFLASTDLALAQHHRHSRSCSSLSASCSSLSPEDGGFGLLINLLQ